MRLIAIGIASAIALSAPAFAEDEAIELREAETCFEFGGAIKAFNKFSDLKPEKRDTVGVDPSARLEIKEEGAAFPERLFFRDAGVETDLKIAPDGRVTDFGLLFAASEDVELCSYDPARAGLPKGGAGMAFSMDMDVQYRVNNGYHDLATLKDGLKDGKSHFKKMAGAMSFMVPKFSYVMINYEAEDVTAQYAAVKAGEAVDGLTPDYFCEEPMINIKQLEEIGADGLKVMGGAYKLMPVPSPKMLAKFASCAEDESEEAPEE